MTVEVNDEPGETDDESIFRLAGVESEPYSMDIEKGDVLRFAGAVGYSEPWYIDEELARETPVGGVIASPTYLIVMRGMEHEALIAAGVDMLHRRGVDGGSEWEYLEPIRVGDRIVAVATVKGFQKKQTSLGEAIFQTIVITYRNQFDKTVVKQIDTRVYY